MSIPYSRESDVTLQGRVSTVLLNKIFSRLVANDNSILPSTYGVPYVWEATWFNDDSEPGYMKGDAVWINTERQSDFIPANKDRLQTYLESNPEYKTRMLACGDDWGKKYALFREVLDSGKLYWLGDVSKPAQLRVCKSNHVKATPDDDRFWEDFFVIRDDNRLRDEVVGQFQRITNEQFEAHLSAYHPESFDGFDFSDFMLKDFSNASALQKYNKTTIRSMAGMDTVKRFAYRRFGDGTIKWFRIWSSGFLEQGGTVDVLDPQAGDTNMYGGTGGRIYTVNLAWEYDGTLIAPCYDSQSTSMEGFHFADGEISLDGDQARKIDYDDVSELGDTPRYFVSLTPQNVDGDVYGTIQEPYGTYVSKEVLSLKNKSFSFLVSDECRYCSYYTSGFTVNVAKHF